MGKQKLFVFYPTCQYHDAFEKGFCAEDTISDGKSFLEKYYEVNNIPQIREGLKKEEFQIACSDDSNSILMAFRGGKVERFASSNDESNSSIELVKQIEQSDFDNIINNHIKIVGYSDITYLLCALLNHGIECYYGPNFLSTFVDSSEKEREVTLKYLQLAITGKEYSIDLDSDNLNSKDDYPQTISGGKADGRLVGGNIDTIITAFQHYEEAAPIRRPNDIIFLEENDPIYPSKEDMEYSPYILFLEKKLDLLAEKGFFKDINGILIGRSSHPHYYKWDGSTDDIVKRDDEVNIIAQYFKKQISDSIPIIANISCSHTHPMVTLPLGRTVTIDTINKKLIVHSKD